MPLNVAIVGPSRSKQGTGPFIAKTFKQLGCDIQAIVSSSLDSAQKAASDLENEYSISCQACQALDESLHNHSIDIVVISSPAHSHLQYLQTSLEGGCHVFCEKPLWWPNEKLKTQNDIDNITSEVVHLVNAYKVKQLFLQLNTQWPYTLPYFYELYPQLKKEHEIESFSMWLSPQSNGAEMIVDSVSHVLSMLYTLIGAGKINNINSNFAQLSNDNDLNIEFDYIHAFADTRVSIALTPSQTFPKPAAYSINGLRVDRHVELPNYLISLRTTDKQVPVRDPLECSVKNFISSIYSKTSLDEVALIDGMTQLTQIYKAVTQQ